MSSEETFIDLHVHSLASDGSESPAKIPVLAREAGLSAVALTDHDTVSGIPEFMESGHQIGIETVPGVEISAKLFKKEVHIVGLFIDSESSELQDLMRKLRDARTQRNELVVAKLRGMGYDISIEEVRSHAGGESIGRPHIAQIMVEKGYVESFQDAFLRFLRRGATAYVPRELPDARDAVPVIHAAHGTAVWAHAVSGQSGARSFARKMLRALCGFGLDAVEAYYSTFSPYETALMIELAEQFHLCCSGGSDFHGTRQPGIQIGIGAGGLRVPADLLEKLKASAAKYR